MEKKRLFTLSHSTLFLSLVFSWCIMMFFPVFVDTVIFKVFFLIQISCVMIYSFLAKKYFPQLRICKAEKLIACVLVALLLLKLIFFRQ